MNVAGSQSVFAEKFRNRLLNAFGILQIFMNISVDRLWFNLPTRTRIASRWQLFIGKKSNLLHALGRGPKVPVLDVVVIDKSFLFDGQSIRQGNLLCQRDWTVKRGIPNRKRREGCEETTSTLGNRSR